MMSRINITFLAFLVGVVFTGMVGAQACGGAFGTIEVTDEKGKAIPGVTIELQGPVAYPDESKAMFGEQATPVAADDAKELLAKEKQNNFYKRTTDYCENPLLQTLGQTKLKYFDPNATPPTGLGFCTVETYTSRFLLTVSAKGYKTAYYRGSFLGGCGYSYKLKLVKK